MGKLKNKSMIMMSEILRKNKKIMMKRLRKDKKVMMKRLCEDNDIMMQRFRDNKKMMRLLREDKNKKMMSVSEDNIKYLPEDVIILILARLPVKILMRFKCVCKFWCHLIKRPSFINMHQRYRNKYILVKHTNDDCTTVLLSFLAYESLNIISPGLEIPHVKNFNVSWPCNGLLLCVSDNIDPAILVLCNPAIRECKLLPQLPFPEDPMDCLVIYKFGLGFDSNKNDYKVIVFVEVLDAYDNVDRYETAVYNLSTNSWRQIIPNLPDVYDLPFINEGVLFNGALHWSCCKNSILSFNVSTEVFHEIQLPEAITQHHHICMIRTVVNDSFSLFAFTDVYNSDPKLLEIWVMKEYGLVGSWMKQASIDGLWIADTIWWYPRFLWKNKTILIEAHKKKKKDELLSYDIDTHEITDIGIFNEIKGSPGVCIYEESFVSIKGERW